MEKYRIHKQDEQIWGDIIFKGTEGTEAKRENCSPLCEKLHKISIQYKNCKIKHSRYRQLSYYKLVF